MNSAALQPDFTLEAVYESLTSLPVFPKVVHQVMQMLDDPDVTNRQISDVLKFDPGLTANILKVTNSAFFGVQQQVNDLDTAVALLGHQRLREVLVTGAAMPFLSRSLSGYEMSHEDLWVHSVGCAVVSEVVARAKGIQDEATVYTASLLHDIGKIVMDLYIGPRLEEVLILAKQEEISFSEAEWRVVGTDHALVGSSILKQWDFPPDIARAVRRHHDPDLYVQDELSACLAMSNIIAVQLGFGVGADGFRYVLDERLLEVMGFDRRELHSLYGQALESYLRAQDLFTMLMG